VVGPVVWQPPTEPSPAEQAMIKAVRRAKLFVFLREHRAELFNEEFQAELAETHVDSPKGQPPVPPARLALATILQAYTKAPHSSSTPWAGTWTPWPARSPLRSCPPHAGLSPRPSPARRP